MNDDRHSINATQAHVKTSDNAITDISFDYLPGYCRFLIDHKLKEFAGEQLRISREMKIPLLKFFEEWEEDRLMELVVQSTGEWLSFLAGNRVMELVEQSIRRWRDNQIPAISREQVEVEDIIMVNYIRKMCLLHFLNEYTNMEEGLKIVAEFDRFIMASEMVVFKNLNDLHRELYNQTEALAHIGNWVLDYDSGKLTWSDEIYRIFELPLQSEISFEKIFALSHADDAELVRNNLDTIHLTSKPNDFYHRVILGSGREKVLHSTGQLLKGAPGAGDKIFGTVQDVTAQKSSEKSLEEEKTFAERLIESSPDMILAYDRQFHIIAWNKKCEEHTKLKKEEVLGKNTFELFPEYNNEKWIKEMNQVFEGKSLHYPQVRFLHSKGFGESFVIPLKNGEHVFGLLSITRDITELVNNAAQLEARNEQLKKSEERYHRMTEEVNDYAILLLSKEGIIENWNRGAEKIKGYKASEIVGKSFKVFYTEGDQIKKLPEKLLNEAIQNGKATHEGWRVRKDGSMFWGSIVITALHDDNRELIGFSKVTRDLTDKKIADDKLKEYARSLQEKNEDLMKINRELESFNYICSHDLQEPLRKIQSFGTRILDDHAEELSARGKEYFNRMTGAANRMQSLIEDLLAFSRASNISEKFERVDLNSLLEEVKATLKFSIDELQAVIESDELPELKVIRFQFMQVFQNLIANALKFVRTGTIPHIKISAEKVNHMPLSPPESDPDKNYVKLTISDNGIGFPQQYADKIFDLFQRLHGKDEYAGTGIGLAICKKIIQNHHGMIRARGEVNKGATIEIFLPDN